MELERERERKRENIIMMLLYQQISPKERLCMVKLDLNELKNDICVIFISILDS